MKKVREITLSSLLDSMKYDLTIEDKILNDLPIGKRFTMGVLIDYYKATKNIIYPILLRLESNGTLIKSKGNYNGRNNITIYKRVK